MEKDLTLIEASLKYSNDYDLGEYLNMKYRDSLSGSEISELVKNHPNYYDLGNMARTIAIKKQQLNS